MVTLRDAVRAVMERKRAVLGEVSGSGDYYDESQARRVASGLDLDYDEAVAVAKSAAEMLVRGIMVEGADPLAAMAGGWMDGLVTGLVLADLRQRNGYG